MDDAMRALILYAYTLGGNAREMARLTGIDYLEVVDNLARACHLDALKKAGMTEDEWRTKL